MLKTLALVVAATLVGGTGHVLLAKGMRLGGDLTESAPDRLGHLVWAAVTNPWVLLGVVLQAVFFGVYLVLLSRADLTQVLPLTALDYVVVTLLAQLVLAEAVTAVRWAGVAFIVIGVALVSRS